MQECHAETEAVPNGSSGAGVWAHRPLVFAKSARNRLSTAGAAFACARDDGRSWPRFLVKEHVTGRS
jgi:hypothetical protein